MPISTLEKFAKGRVSLSIKLVKALSIQDGDAFKAEAEGKKILLTKIDAEEVKTK